MPINASLFSFVSTTPPDQFTNLFNDKYTTSARRSDIKNEVISHFFDENE